MKLENILIQSVAVIVCWSFASKSFADTSNVEQILNDAQDFLYSELERDIPNSRIEVNIKPIDNRLKIKECSKDLDYFMTTKITKSQNTAIGVKCQGQNSWTTYLQANVNIYHQALVATKPINKGDIITDSDISVIEANISSLKNGFFDETSSVVGMVAKRNLRSGSIFNPRSIEEPTLIKRGEIITIYAKAKGLEVKIQGSALTDGKMGKKIKVKNLMSQRIVEATVISPGKVEVKI